ncbi:DNA translocase FtsK [Kineosporia sp. NBRC 101731]|uniref:DNA translocase FtsK n=1 Tax=Kineosporia sp. NBRC 101731 TaxID=3032199 RepID=UPI0024A196D7|nr:DNA translocase FtsK [Kineosporia sp. NBRC 101731]GLY32007.1 hypothetical protein Kisp02_53720 [Kineosporia sp. NBRC 101731]
MTTTEDEIVPDDTSALGTPVDTGPARMILKVSARDLRAGLTSVKEHQSLDDLLPELCRMRAYVRSGNLFLSATDRFTLGMACVSVWENEYDDDGEFFDLSRVQVGEMLAMFKAGKSSDDIADDFLEIRVSDRFIVVTDVAGMIPGKSVSWPRIENADGFPNLVDMMGRIQGLAGTATSSAMHTNGKMLKRFDAATKVYENVLTIRPTGEKAGALAMACGESFRGALMPVPLAELALAELEANDRAWDQWLGAVDIGTGELPPIVPAPRDPEPDVAEVEVLAGQTDAVEAAGLELLIAAAELVVTEQYCTKAMLQRKLRVGFVKAADLLIELEQENIVGPEADEKFPVLVAVEDLPELLADLREGPASE